MTDRSDCMTCELTEAAMAGRKAERSPRPRKPPPTPPRLPGTIRLVRFTAQTGLVWRRQRTLYCPKGIKFELKGVGYWELGRAGKEAHYTVFWIAQPTHVMQMKLQEDDAEKHSSPLNEEGIGLCLSPTDSSQSECREVSHLPLTTMHECRPECSESWQSEATKARLKIGSHPS